uniref:Uncharacterized protein n=1 Tax=Zea mays TaxID=4577 RepID=A0A804U9Y9_MAIZE
MTPSRRRRKGSGRRWRLPAPAPGFKPPIRPRIQWNGRYDICQNRENVWKVRSLHKNVDSKLKKVPMKLVSVKRILR